MSYTVTELENTAREIRKKVIEMIYHAGSGHPGGSLSVVDILVTLYFGGILKYDKNYPNWEGRDYFILSNGHVCPAWYAVLAKAGFFPEEELFSLRNFGSPLQGHPEKGRLNAIETTTGSLGQGICVGVGIALGLKRQKRNNHVFVITSDGEQDEGSVWESLRITSSYELNNFTMIIDRNGMQIDGPTEKISMLEPLAEKYQAFGWETKEIDGHNFRKLIDAFQEKEKIKPLVIIAKTIRGKGVSFMEDSPEFHAKKLTQEEYQKAIRELSKNE